ncbi:MAG TPA: hypothetical protein DCM32_05240 [Xanthomonadaceae bacterium]|nr:hypothetical protein [Xanthomonadaceae bacterium]
MFSTPPPSRPGFPDDVFDLAVIGGGPAGLATALAARAQAPHWRVLWCRGPERVARTFFPAYSGDCLAHLLNVPVERMGLDARAPTDFFDWLRHAHPSRGVQAGDFVPRCWFGDYLAARAAVCDAEERFGAVSRLLHDSRGWRIDLEGEDRCSDDGCGRAQVVRAQRVALCLGMPAGAPMPAAPANWVADPWAWWSALDSDARGGPNDAPAAVAAPPWPGDDDSVLVVGSGLTAVDMVLGLRERGFGGLIRVVSPAGCWSEAHAPAPALDPAAREALDSALDAAVSARALLRAIRDAARRHPWRAVIDALRADTNTRWAALAVDERHRLLRHAFGHWNRHRHRMAPAVLATLLADTGVSIETGRIHIVDGRIVKRQRGVDTPLDVALALDCRGPGLHAAPAGDSLLQRLLRDGVLEPGPLGAGARTPADPNLALLGCARFGELFETTAVPELRQQAVDVVRRWCDQAAPSQSRGTR